MQDLENDYDEKNLATLLILKGARQGNKDKGY
jgi:hypothetical protein